MKKKTIIKIIILLFFTLACKKSEAASPLSPSYSPSLFNETLGTMMLYQSFYQDCCNRLIELMDKAEDIEPYINPHTEPLTWQRYLNYYNSIVNVYNDVSKNGTDSSTRTKINNLRRDFSVIKSIQVAYERRSQLAQSQMIKLNSQNITCDRLYSEISLDEFLDGKTPVINYK